MPHHRNPSLSSPSLTYPINVLLVGLSLLNNEVGSFAVPSWTLNSLAFTPNHCHYYNCQPFFIDGGNKHDDNNLSNHRRHRNRNHVVTTLLTQKDDAADTDPALSASSGGSSGKQERENPLGDWIASLLPQPTDAAAAAGGAGCASDSSKKDPSARAIEDKPVSTESSTSDQLEASEGRRRVVAKRKKTNLGADNGRGHDPSNTAAALNQQQRQRQQQQQQQQQQRKNRKNTTTKEKKKHTRPRGRPLTSLAAHNATVSGPIVAIEPYGLFVQTPYDIRGGRYYGCALLHITNIRNDDRRRRPRRTDDLTELFSVGDVIENARVIGVDHDKSEVEISLLDPDAIQKRNRNRKRKPKPRRTGTRELSEFNVGDRVGGVVRSIESYGAFIDVGCSAVDGLLHISRITQKRVSDIRDHVDIGDEVSVRIIDIDRTKKTMAVSMLSPEADEYIDRRRRRRHRRSVGGDGDEMGEEKKDPAFLKAQLDLLEETIRDLEEALAGR